MDVIFFKCLFDINCFLNSVLENLIKFIGVEEILLVFNFMVLFV